MFPLLVPENSSLLPVVSFSMYLPAPVVVRVIVMSVIRADPPGVALPVIGVAAILTPAEVHSYQRGSTYRIVTGVLRFIGIP